MTATYSQVKAKLNAAGFSVTKVGSKIKVAKGGEEQVFASPVKALEWFSSLNQDEAEAIVNDMNNTDTLTIKEAASKTIFELIAPSDRVEIEQKPYQIEELQVLAGLEDNSSKEQIFKTLAQKGLAFFYQTDAWYPLPIR